MVNPRTKKRLLVLAVALVVVLALALSLPAAYFLFHQVYGDDFDSNGVSIHYTVEGEGPPVILVHGYAVNSDLNWRLMGVIGALAEDFQVIAMDCRGHGLSGRPHDPQQYGVEMAEDVVRLMHHLELEKAHLAGYSMGGAIAMTLATVHPDSFWSIAGGGSGWFKAGTRDTDVIRRVIRAKEATSGGRLLLQSLTGTGPGFSVVIVDLVERAINDAEALRAVGEGFRELCMEEAALSTNSVPFLSIVGSLDGRRESAESLAGVMPHLESVVIPGGTHDWTPRDPAFAAALIRFFTKHGCYPEKEEWTRSAGAFHRLHRWTPIQERGGRRVRGEFGQG